MFIRKEKKGYSNIIGILTEFEISSTVLLVLAENYEVLLHVNISKNKAATDGCTSRYGRASKFSSKLKSLRKMCLWVTNTHKIYLKQRLKDKHEIPSF